MSGQWPPEWEDSDTGLPDAWTDSDAGPDPEAPEVTLFLASVPSPVLPASFEARISAAIAAEATARANGMASAGMASAGMASAGTGSAGAGIAAAETEDAKTTDRSSSPEFSPAAAESGSATEAKRRRRRTSAGSRGAARRSGPTGSRPGGRRRRFRMPSPAVSASLVIILFVVGFAVVASQGGPSSSSSSPDSGLSNTGTSAPAAGAASEPSAFAGAHDGSAPQYETNRSAGNGQHAKFVVTESGTRYQGATLASQVREQLDAVRQGLVTPAASPVPNGPSASAATSGAVPSAAASASAAGPPGTAPSARLAGCVSQVTDGATPSLVDQASYDGIPAYIIAVPTRVWVVRLGCTAADPQEITRVSLTGLFRESQRPRIG
jgi:trimeric autotransporter adhesin